MTDNEKLIQAINRHLDNMDVRRLRTMLIVAIELDKGDDQKEAEA